MLPQQLSLNGGTGGSDGDDIDDDLWDDIDVFFFPFLMMFYILMKMVGPDGGGWLAVATPKKEKQEQKGFALPLKLC